jgi:hypothetical protein
MFVFATSDWLPRTEARRLVWAIGGAIILGFVVVLVSTVDKTLWEWLKLLVVPAVLAVGGYLFTRSENRRRERIAEEQTTLDRELADERRQDDMLQAYLDGMAQLLTDKDRPLQGAQMGDSLSTVARARTLTVLPGLDGQRKARVVQFLYESRLIAKDRPLLDLSGAELREADLADSYEWKDAWNFGFPVNLRGADLSRADLTEANLLGADLTGARGETGEGLEIEVKELGDATMPNGQKYEEWLKSRREDGENGGPS